MKRKALKNDYAIALAWPETKCRQAGSWYDGLMDLLSISKNHYYRVGHAAVVIISAKDGQCHYFDFGRYHAPFGHGRVRCADSDHELLIRTKAGFQSDGSLANLSEILNELSSNQGCHGTGPLHASLCRIDANTSLQRARDMHNAGYFLYGPFIPQGTNCSRFVRSVLLAGKPALTNTLRLLIPPSLSPTPSANVAALGNRIILKPFQNETHNQTIADEQACIAG